MQILLEISKEFENEYKGDAFKDFFSRVLCDIENGTLCGNYEKETAEMFLKVFDESKVVDESVKGDLISRSAVIADIRKRSYIDNALSEIFETIIDEQPTAYNDGWIPCSERLPEEYGEYFVWWTDLTQKEYCEITEYHPQEGWIGDIPQAFNGEYTVLAWQPLPPAYQPKGE